MNLEEIDAMRKVEKENTRKATEKCIMTMNEGNGESSFITKGEIRGILHDLIAMGLIGHRTKTRSSELKLELMLNDVKLEGSNNHLSWSKRA